MTDSVRVFLALDLSDEARWMLTELSRRLASAIPEGARRLPPENLHLTLKFLGHLPETDLPRLLHALVPRLAKLEPFEVQIGGLGAYPNGRAARVVWVGTVEGAAPLARLARQCESAAARVGVKREHRPYQGHLTLARLRRPARVVLERVGDVGRATVPVREVVLYRSDLSPSGPHYTPLARLPLGQVCEPEIDLSFTHPSG